MNSKVKSLLPALQDETAAAREKFAQQAFALELVKLHLVRAAARGQTSFRIRLPNNLSGISGTDAAKALEAFCKCEGVRLTWEKRPAELPDEGRHVDVVEPEFSW
jgi:tryptophanase